MIRLLTFVIDRSGVSINTAVVQAAIPSLPFGGIGNSGMGVHHGIEGFREVSDPSKLFN